MLDTSQAFQYAPKPAYAPERDFSYLSEGDEIARLSKLGGRCLMPWQKMCVDVATEYRLDILGRRVYRYATILITVPRQSGKTTLMGPVKLHRIMTRPGIDCFSTAQTGKDAGKRMKDLINWVIGSPLSPIFKPKFSNGGEGLIVRKTGSSVTRFAPTPGAIHGETPYFVDLDEIWKYTEALGDSIMGGISPSMITIKQFAQVWMISTMGTANSGFMNKYVKTGRQGSDPSLCYIEFSMPAGMNPFDPKTWWSFHPALGNTLTVEDMQTEAAKVAAGTMSHAEWMRAYMNVLTEAENPVIDPENWARMTKLPEEIPSRSSLAITYEVAPGNERAAVMASWRDLDGMAVSRVLHSAPTALWLPNYVRRLAKLWKPAVIAADDGGPSRAVTDKLMNPPIGHDGQPLYTPVDVRTPGMRDFGTACDTWLTAARDEKTFKHDGSVSFSRAVAHAVLRTNNGTERIDRDKSTGPVCEVIGSIVGIWAYDHQDDAEPDQIY